MTGNDSNHDTATQYDAISSAYTRLYPPNEAQRSPFLPALFEEAQLRSAVISSTGSLEGKHVLDLAGGSGYHSFRLLTWGASSVTSVDISRAQVTAGQAEAKRRGLSQSRLRFIVGDASSDDFNTAMEGEASARQFDVVFAAWLLNYAASAADLCRIFANIAAQLKPGGVFIGLTTPPLLTTEPWEEVMLAYSLSEAGIWGKWGSGGIVLRPMPDDAGYRVLTQLRLVGESEIAGEVPADFENHHIRKDVIERAVESTGTLSKLAWLDCVCPDGLREQHPEFATDAALLPHARACITKKLN